MIEYHRDIDQGTDQWHELRRGILTASEMHNIITPTLKVANNKETRCHLWELLAQRITGYVEPQYISDDMLRGTVDEMTAVQLYNKHYGGCESIGFITNDKWGFKIGYSPDALVGDDGLVECKSRRQKYQIQTIVSDEMPKEYEIQVQTGLLVSERKWCDFISYSAGLPMFTKRIYPNAEIQDAIVAAAVSFEAHLQDLQRDYEISLKLPQARLIPTERKIEGDIIL